LEGPWRWRISSKEDGTVPQGTAGLPLPASTAEGYNSSIDGQEIIAYTINHSLGLELYEETYIGISKVVVS